MAKNKNLIGSWAFLIGVIIAIAFALFGTISQEIAIILIVIGLLVGILNITDGESTPFLMSAIILIIASALGNGVVSLIAGLENVLNALLLIFVPATIIVAIRNVFSLARK